MWNKNKYSKLETSQLVEMRNEEPLLDDSTATQFVKKKDFYLCIGIILLTLLLAESSRGLVVPSLYLYIKSVGGNSTWVGLTVSAYSFGRLIGSVLLGWWYNKRGSKEVIIVSLIIGVFGNLLYALGDVTSIWMILFSRALTGFGTGILSIARAFIGEQTTKEERTRFMAISSAVQFIGASVVPGFAIAFTSINFNIGALTFNEFTTPGYLLMLLNLGLIPLVLRMYPYQPPKEEAPMKNDIDVLNRKIIYLGIALFIGLNFVARGVLSVLETVGTPVFLASWHDKDHDEVQDTSLMMLVFGVLGLGFFFLIDYLKGKVKESHMLITSFVCITIGSLLLVNWDPDDHRPISIIEFGSGAFFIWSVGSPIAQTIIISTFSKILGSQPQGTMMGWIGSAGSVGRILFPIFAGSVATNISFGFSASISVLCAVAVFWYERHVKLNLITTPQIVSDL